MWPHIKISDTINNAIPQRKPDPVIGVCKPWIATSREISRHHWAIIIISNTRPIRNKYIEFKWSQDTIPVVKGDGLTSQIKAEVTHLPHDKDGTLYLTFIEICIKL